MAQVTGLGGVFYKVADPTRTSAWYKETLGIGGEWGAMFPWRGDEQAYSLVSPFKADTDYFPAEKHWMLNLRVTGLDELLDQLRSAGIDVITKDEWNDPSVGRFARIHDPEGNPIELWEPADEAAAS